jgi:plasmid stabilization system protein ParE
MTQRRIRWTVRALPRFDQIGAYIEKDDPNAAAGVVTRLVAAVDMLAELPAAGRIGRITGTRELVLSDISYIIPYRLRHDIEILTVMHAS